MLREIILDDKKEAVCMTMADATREVARDATPKDRGCRADGYISTVWKMGNQVTNRVVMEVHYKIEDAS